MRVISWNINGFRSKIVSNKPFNKTTENINDNDLSNWIVRIELNRVIMLEKNITMDDIQFAIYKSYKEEVDCITESAIDYVESKLYERIKANDTASIIFFLKTRAKSRGYQERTELVMPEARKFEIEVLGPADESTN